MQKKLIALALAGLASSSAFAQTNVTIYGIVDEFLGYSSASNNCTKDAVGLCIPGTGGDQTAFGLGTGGLSGTRLGFKGEEALGNGLKAIFLYELGSLNPGEGGAPYPGGAATSNGITNTRQSYVGLSGGWGTAVGGRLQTPGYDFSVMYNPMSGSIFSPQNWISGQSGMTIQPGNNGRLNNAIAYISPNFSGFTGKLAYAFGEQTTGSNLPGGFDSAQGVWGLGLDYANGPLAVGLAYHNLSNIAGTSNALGARDLSQWELAIGASYDFKIVKLFGSWQNLNQDNFRTTVSPVGALGVQTPIAGSINGGSLDGNLWNLGGKIPVGANGAVNLAYSQYYNNISGPSNDQRVGVYGIDYEYSFSKRTTAYVGYSYTDNGNNTAYGYNYTSGAAVPTDDNSAWLLGAGIRHSF